MVQMIQYLNEIGRRDVVTLGDVLELDETVIKMTGQIQNGVDAIA
jgi:hypothetical protein